MNREMRLETKLIHAGEPSHRIEGAITLPIFQTSTYEYRGDTTYHDIRYLRLSNTPNHLALHAKLAALENAEAAVVTGSGMAAISAALLSVLRPGDHLIIQDLIYGGTHALLTHHFQECGILYDFVDGSKPDEWKARLRPTTRAFFVESLSNPLLSVTDLKAVVEFSKRHGLVSLIDNTFTSPVNFRPAEHGFDLSLHSATKYLNGHSDLVAGAIIGRKTLVEKAHQKLNILGGSLDAHGCFLLQRGMKTLSLRVRHQNHTAHEVAQFLSNHPKIAKVHYPSLESHPGHTTARSLMVGFGGVLSFEVKGGLDAAKAAISKMKLAAHAPSLGGIETLVTRPAMSTHGGLTPEERRKLGISDNLVRYSVGLEAHEDLIEDLRLALE